MEQYLSDFLKLYGKNEPTDIFIYILLALLKHNSNSILSTILEN